MKGLLYKTEVKINDDISIVIPTVGQIIENEDKYYQLTTLIVSTPYDMMVQLDDIGIDFTTITDFELFCILFEQIKNMDTSLVFGNLDLSNFILAVNNDNGDTVLYDSENDIIIDKAIHNEICQVLRNILSIQKHSKRPANDEAKKFMIERARRKIKRETARLKKKNTTQLEDLIISLVNTEQFPYDYESVLGLSIFKFNSSLYQIIHKIKFDNLMIGCYAGTVKMDELSQKDLSWVK